MILALGAADSAASRPGAAGAAAAAANKKQQAHSARAALLLRPWRRLLLPAAGCAPNGRQVARAGRGARAICLGCWGGARQEHFLRGTKWQKRRPRKRVGERASAQEEERKEEKVLAKAAPRRPGRMSERTLYSAPAARARAPIRRPRAPVHSGRRPWAPQSSLGAPRALARPEQWAREASESWPAGRPGASNGRSVGA